MTNIEKLYELAGINICTRKDKECKDCGYYFFKFTEQKQLDIIKYFSENIDFLELSHNGEEFEFYSSCSRTSDKDFSQALASFIYYKWDDLTETQKEEVKGILE